MWLMLQQDDPEDYVVATGTCHTVRDFATMAFREAGIELVWKGKGIDEVGIDAKSGKNRIVVDKRYYRPTEVSVLVGDASKAAQKLGWRPKTLTPDLVKLMVTHDLEYA